MSYASYSENLIERINEQLWNFRRVASQVKRQPTTGADLAIAHQEKLREILTLLGTLLSQLRERLDDPAIVEKLSAVSLGEASARAVRKAEKLEVTNKELHRHLKDTNKRARGYQRTLQDLRAEVDDLQKANKRLTQLRETTELRVTKFQAELATVKQRVDELQRENEDLQKQIWKQATKDVRPLGGRKRAG